MKGRALHSAVVHLIDLGMNLAQTDDARSWCTCPMRHQYIVYAIGSRSVYSDYEETPTSPKQS